MAEIKIEKKKPMWPWIALILIILAIIAFLVYQNQANDDYLDDDNTDMVDDMNDTIDNDTTIYDSTNTYDDGSASMMALMEAMKDSTRFGTDSTYTQTALHNLAKVTVAKAKSKMLESSSALSDLEQYTSMNNTSDSRVPDTNNLASEFKSVSEDIVTVIDALYSKNGMTMEQDLKKLKETSNKISGTNALPKQQNTIQSFFRQAHDALHNINS